jgi:hypothetical protein
MRYVKTCPRCGHLNGEEADVCVQDGEFLGMVPAVPAPDRPPERALPPLEPDSAPASPARSDPSPASAQAVTVAADPVLYLDCEGSGQCHAIRPGWTVGQSHPSGTAEAQLAGIPGVQFVHRRHCRFEHDDGIWYLCPLPQADYTNPTTINGRPVAPGERAAVRNGDRIALAGVRLTVRMLQT